MHDAHRTFVTSLTTRFGCLGTETFSFSVHIRKYLGTYPFLTRWQCYLVYSVHYTTIEQNSGSEVSNGVLLCGDESLVLPIIIAPEDPFSPNLSCSSVASRLPGRPCRLISLVYSIVAVDPSSPCLFRVCHQLNLRVRDIVPSSKTLPRVWRF